RVSDRQQCGNSSPTSRSRFLHWTRSRPLPDRVGVIRQCRMILGLHPIWRWFSSSKRIVHMSDVVRLNDGLRMGLIKSVYLLQEIQESDPDYAPGDDETAERKPPVSRAMARAAWTGLVLQLVSLLDDGFEDFLEQRYPNQACRKLGDRIGFLKAKGH